LALSTGLLVGAVLLGVSAILFLIWFERYMRSRLARRQQRTEHSEEAEDAAYNRVDSAGIFADRMAREGYDVRTIQEILASARMDLVAGKYQEAHAKARKAQEELLRIRETGIKVSPAASNPSPDSKDPPGVSQDPPVARELAAPVGKPDFPGTPPTPSQLPEYSEDNEIMDEGGDEASNPPSRKTIPKNMLEARFQLRRLGEDLQRFEAQGQSQKPEFREAQRWQAQAQAAFDRKEYTEALRLGLRGRRRLVPEEVETIALTPGTVVESPPTEPVLTAQRSSGPPLEPEVEVDPYRGPQNARSPCPRCGRENRPMDRFCRGCGVSLAPMRCPRCKAELEPNDRFCASCGSPVAPA